MTAPLEIVAMPVIAAALFGASIARAQPAPDEPIDDPKVSRRLGTRITLPSSSPPAPSARATAPAGGCDPHRGRPRRHRAGL